MVAGGGGASDYDYVPTEADLLEPRMAQRVTASPFRFNKSRTLQAQTAVQKHSIKPTMDQTVAPDGTPLVSFEELPEWMKEHFSPHITINYRMCSTYRAALMSMFYWHNCWLDTATALFNILHATALQVWVFFFSGLTFQNADYVPFLMFYLTCLLHTPPSAGYHWIGCSGKSLSTLLFWQRFDYLFIHVSSIPLAVALSWYPFANHPIAFAVSVVGVVIVASYTASVISTPFDAQRRVKLIVPLVLFYLMAVLVTIGNHSIHGMFSSPELWWGLGIILSLGVGAYVYGIGYPECVYPNFWLSSHSLMHLTVNSAYFCEFGFMIAAFQRYYEVAPPALAAA